MTTDLPNEQKTCALLPQQALDQAVGKVLLLASTHQQTGDHIGARELYLSVLAIQPNHAGANHALGSMALQAQRPTDALPHLETALNERPDQGKHWVSYIDALTQAGQQDVARSVLEIGRQHGLETDVVAELVSRTTAPPLHQQLAESKYFCLQSQRIGGGSTPQATLTARSPKKKASRKALGKAPSIQEMNALVALFDQGRRAEVEAPARSLTLRFPRHGFGWKMLGASLSAQGRTEDALLSMQKSVQLVANDAEGLSNLGRTLLELGRSTEAEASQRRALALNSNYVPAINSLGVILLERGRLSEAEGFFRRTLAIAPDDVIAHSNLGITLQRGGRLTDAIQIFRRLAELKVNDDTAYSTLIFCMSHDTTVTSQQLQEENLAFGERFEAPLRDGWHAHTNDKDPNRCLQVGFVSGDLRNHAVASFIDPVLNRLSTSPQLAMHAYSNFAVEDLKSQRIKGYVKHWHPVAGMSDDALAEQIRADGIDILIDLSGHTAHHRLLTFARKPAPVQASWIGFPGTTGLQAMDYYLADKLFAPPGLIDSQFTEKIVRLPALAPFLPYGGAPPVNGLPAQKNGYITFGSFNRVNKISQPVVALWSEILRALPTSRMVLGAMPKADQKNHLTDWFADEGIELGRLSFYPVSSMEAYLSLYHQVDICLDTFPYNGGTTSQHALWMGVPLLTLAGATPPSRAGAYALGHFGLDEFVAHSKQEFVKTGVHWAGRLDALAGIRASLRERIGRSAMGQPGLVAAGVESAFRIMWQIWCAGLAPESFEVTPKVFKDATTEAST